MNDFDDEYTEDSEIQELLEKYEIIKLPRGWESYSKGAKLDFIGERILVIARKKRTTKHSEMKEEGWLSSSQLLRRRKREVYSKFGDLDAIPFKPGDRDRVYVDPNYSAPSYPEGYAIDITPGENNGPQV